MEHIGDALPKLELKKSKKTERGELLVYFCGRLNESRERDGLKPLSVGRVARLTQGLSVRDLYYLKSVCEKAKHFSKKFWWEIDPKKHEAK